LTKLGFLMVIIMMRSRRRRTKTKLEAFPVLGPKRRGTLCLWQGSAFLSLSLQGILNWHQATSVALLLKFRLWTVRKFYQKNSNYSPSLT
jgi:hypothetical protein